MKIIDDQPPIDPKLEKLKEEILEVFHEANRLIKFRVFHLKKNWRDRPYNELKHVHNWMQTAIGLSKAVKEIESRHSPEVWNRYQLFGIKGLAEQTLLNVRTQQLQTFLNANKPPLIIKSKPSTSVKHVKGVERGPENTAPTSRG